MHKDDLAKHEDMTHRKIKCACGTVLEADAIKEHRSDHCRLRLVKCKFCKIAVSVAEQTEHESYCGSKSIACDICGQDVPQKRMSHHKAFEHNINPSVRPGGGKGVPPSFLTKSNSGASGGSGDGGGSFGGGGGDNFGEGEDADLQRALASSMAGSGAGPDSAMQVDGDEDTMLNQAILASLGVQNEPAKSVPSSSKNLQSYTSTSSSISASSSSSSLANQMASSTSQSAKMDTEEAGEGDGAATPIEIDGDDWGDEDGDDGAFDDDEDDGFGSPVVADGGGEGSGGEYPCPYCDKGQANYEALISHLSSCSAVS
jgi:hypothetical protein